MPVLHSKVKNNTLYEIRSAGKSIRLYTDGVFHSQWNPNVPLGNNVWELLFLPAFFSRKIDRIALLGLGGGALVNLYAHYLPHVCTEAVEIDAEHIRLAKRWFCLSKHISDNRLKIHCTEASAWVQNKIDAYASTGNSNKYDLIIEDLFVATAPPMNDACRAIPATERWLRQLNRLLTTQGMIIMNFASRNEFLSSAALSYAYGLRGIKSIFTLSLSHYENAIVVFSRKLITKNDLWQNLASAGVTTTQIKRMQKAIVILPIK